MDLVVETLVISSVVAYSCQIPSRRLQDPRDDRRPGKIQTIWTFHTPCRGQSVYSFDFGHFIERDLVGRSITISRLGSGSSERRFGYTSGGRGTDLSSFGPKSNVWKVGGRDPLVNQRDSTPNK